MASSAFTQTVVLPNRPHDYLFDPIYTVSCQNDHIKALSRAQTHDVVIQPIYENMFSALGHFPPSQYNLRYHTQISDLGQNRDASHYESPNVIGGNRFKYFRRPIVPFVSTFAGQVVYAKRPAPTLQQQAHAELKSKQGPQSKTIGIQTLYRESEAQTDPYSPEYIVKSTHGHPPELLALSTLKFGAGLPAGIAELEMIERARIKRAWEAELPQVVDKETFQLRLKMMEEMELKEWTERENEIKRLQEARLAILKKLILKKEKENEDVHNKRLERIWQKKLQERDAHMKKIQKKKLKAIRKLTEKRSKFENKIEKRDIIADYANYGSSVYAPKAREGVLKSGESLDMDLIEFENYSSLIRLESNFSDSVLNASVSIPKENTSRRSTQARRDHHLQQELKIMDENLRQRKLKIQEQEKPLKYAQKLEKPPQRPPTPRVATPQETDDDWEQAALILQNLIRGRVIQNQMYNGKERRLTLINELRTRHLIQKSMHTSPDENQTPIDSQKEEEKEKIKEQEEPARQEISTDDGLDLPGGVIREVSIQEEELSAMDSFVRKPTLDEGMATLFESNIQAEYVGKMLDFLTKELVRLREERRIAAMVELAHRTRRMREAEESGTRQNELTRREAEDEIFRQVVQIHQETVESYLQDIILQSVDKTSDEQAKKQVLEYADKLNAIVTDISSRQGDQMVVADLVSSFLIPEVERQTLRESIKLNESKYLLAAHKVLHDTELTIEDQILTPKQEK